ncbi:MAG: calcium:proton antiporter [Steroidobacteraceae bacterium]
MKLDTLKRWQTWVPVLALSLGVYDTWVDKTPELVLVVIALVATVLAAVYHAEVIAERVGEPYGTLVLAVAVTIIEVALIISLMLSTETPVSTIVRDTVFAAVMIITTGMVGVCMLAGAWQHGEQTFTRRGVSAALATLSALAVLTLVLPNFTISASGGAYSNPQLAFVGFVSLVLYGAFVFVQTIRHRDYFLDEIHEKILAENEALAASGPPVEHVERAPLGWTFVLLVIALVAVVLLAKTLAPGLTELAVVIGAPVAAAGVFIAAIVLLPESLAAFRAARANRLQTSINLALGSALASIGLTIPTLAVISIAMGWTLDLGLGDREIVLLALSLLVCTQSFSTGRTTILQGTVHLVIFAVYLFTTIVP